MLVKQNSKGLWEVLLEVQTGFGPEDEMYAFECVGTFESKELADQFIIEEQERLQVV